MKTNQIFQFISYIQYPLVLVALFLAYYPMFKGEKIEVETINNVMIFLGLAISFATLQDTTKVQNKLSLRVWQNPVLGKIFLPLMSLLMALSLLIGIYGLFVDRIAILSELSVGLIVLGVGFINFIKASAEMF